MIFLFAIAGILHHEERFRTLQTRSIRITNKQRKVEILQDAHGADVFIGVSPEGVVATVHSFDGTQPYRFCISKSRSRDYASGSTSWALLLQQDEAISQSSEQCISLSGVFRGALDAQHHK